MDLKEANELIDKLLPLYKEQKREALNAGGDLDKANEMYLEIRELEEKLDIFVLEEAFEGSLNEEQRKLLKYIKSNQWRKDELSW